MGRSWKWEEWYSEGLESMVFQGAGLSLRFLLGHMDDHGTIYS